MVLSIKGDGSREVKERDSRTEQEVREVTKRYLESGSPGVAIIVENFDSGVKKARASNHGPFIIVRTREEVDMLGHTIDSGIVLSITIDKLRVFINKTLSILSAYQ